MSAGAGCHRRAAPLRVRQRGHAGRKGRDPHSLVMSATPISPHTGPAPLRRLRDISILDELPPRTPVKTRCITGKTAGPVLLLDQEIDKGAAGLSGVPHIGGRLPDGGLNAVKTYYEDIAKALRSTAGGSDARQAQAQGEGHCHGGFAGRLDALVSTTVIEVGVDAPNASVMVENAELRPERSCTSCALVGRCRRELVLSGQR